MKTRKRIKRVPQPSLSSLVLSLKSDKETTTISNEIIKPFSYSKVVTKNLGREGVKGVQWSPDFTCILTSVERSVNLLEVDSKTTLNEVIQVIEGEPVYDYCWYPRMNSSEPATCCFASISRGSPIHLWDAYQNNLLRASYSLRTEQDEPIWGLSLKLTDHRVICGLDSAIYVWDITRPGLPIQRRKTYRTNRTGSKGLVSCLAVAPGSSEENILTAGFYNGNIVTYSKEQRVISKYQAQRGGVTQIKYHQDHYLWSGGRRSNEILCFDTRKGRGEILHRINRICHNNQKLEFEVIENETSTMVISGGTGTNDLCFWQIKGGDISIFGNIPLDNVGNGVSYNQMNKSIAVATGQRPRVNLVVDSDSDEQVDVGEEKTFIGGGVSIYEQCCEINSTG